MKIRTRYFENPYEIFCEFLPRFLPSFTEFCSKSRLSFLYYNIKQSLVRTEWANLNWAKEVGKALLGKVLLANSQASKARLPNWQLAKPDLLWKKQNGNEQSLMAKPKLPANFFCNRPLKKGQLCFFSFNSLP